MATSPLPTGRSDGSHSNTPRRSPVPFSGNNTTTAATPKGKKDSHRLQRSSFENGETSTRKASSSTNSSRVTPVKDRKAGNTATTPSSGGRPPLSAPKKEVKEVSEEIVDPAIKIQKIARGRLARIKSQKLMEQTKTSTTATSKNSPKKPDSKATPAKTPVSKRSQPPKKHKTSGNPEASKESEEKESGIASPLTLPDNTAEEMEEQKEAEQEEKEEVQMDESELEAIERASALVSASQRLTTPKGSIVASTRSSRVARSSLKQSFSQAVLESGMSQKEREEGEGEADNKLSVKTDQLVEEEGEHDEDQDDKVAVVEETEADPNKQTTTNTTTANEVEPPPGALRSGLSTPQTPNSLRSSFRLSFNALSSPLNFLKSFALPSKDKEKDKDSGDESSQRSFSFSRPRTTQHSTSVRGSRFWSRRSVSSNGDVNTSDSESETQSRAKTAPAGSATGGGLDRSLVSPENLPEPILETEQDKSEFPDEAEEAEDEKEVEREEEQEEEELAGEQIQPLEESESSLMMTTSHKSSASRKQKKASISEKKSAKSSAGSSRKKSTKRNLSIDTTSTAAADRPLMSEAEALLRIQLLFRRSLAYRRFLQRKEKTLQLQAQAAMIIDWSVVTIQKIARGRQGRKRFKRIAELRHQELQYKRQVGVIKIQALARQCSAKRRVQKLQQQRKEEQARIDYLRSLQKNKKKEKSKKGLVKEAEEEEDEEEADDEKEETKTKTTPQKKGSVSSNTTIKRSPSSLNKKPKTPETSSNAPEVPKIDLTAANLATAAATAPQLQEIDLKIKYLEELEQRLKQSEENVKKEALKAEERVAEQLRLLEEKTKQAEAERLAQQQLMQLAVGQFSNRSPFMTTNGGMGTGSAFSTAHPPASGRPRSGTNTMMSTQSRPGGPPPANAMRTGGGGGAMTTGGGIAMMSNSHHNTSHTPTLVTFHYEGHDWVQLWDANNQLHYWWCEALQISQWNRPDEEPSVAAEDYETNTESGYESVGGMTDYSTDHEGSFYSESEFGDRPVTEGAVGEEWHEYWDEQAQAKYWYNSVTGEASWTPPEHLNNNMLAITDGTAGVTSGNNTAMNSTNNGWASYIDEETGQLYWHNIHTGEVRWDY